MISILITLWWTVLAIRYPFLPQRTFDRYPSVEETDGSTIEIGKRALMAKFNINQNDFRISSVDYAKNAITYLYANRYIDNLKVSNEVASVTIKNNKVLAIAGTLSPSKLGSNSPKFRNRAIKISILEAIKLAESEIGAAKDNIPASKALIAKPDGTHAYCYQFQLKDLAKNIFCRVSIDAETGDIVQVVNYGASFSIDAIEFTALDPQSRFTTFNNEADSLASPDGWNKIANISFTETRGNNVISMNNNQAAEGGPNLIFSSDFDALKEPTEPQNIRASIINAFYTINKLHDIFYQFGFTESAGNFQEINYAKGGSANDPVNVVVQSANGRNNARFFSPPDGQPGEMQLFLFDFTRPMRDSALEQLVVIHEYGHGVTNRLTGAGGNPECSFSFTQNALGEAWSDIFAFMLTRKGSEKASKPFVIGSYSTNMTNGIRMFPYSMDFKINPLTFNNITTLSRPHDVGLLWGNIMFDIYWKLIRRYGFSDNWYNSEQMKGNIIMMKLIFAALKTSVCNPTFLQAREAFLSADTQVTNGKHTCLIWDAFATRGMGIYAKEKLRDFVFNYEQITESYKVPRMCRQGNRFMNFIRTIFGMRRKEYND